MPRILSVSRNPRLLSGRNNALALAGYSVASPKDAEDAAMLFSQEEFDAVIIGHSIEPDVRRELINYFRSWKPTICVVFAYTEEAEEEALADENVDITAGPTLLLAALAKLLRKSETESA
jgi:DNA-binding response OmpR family regulator